jgi:hypothetical protein
VVLALGSGLRLLDGRRWWVVINLWLYFYALKITSSLAALCAVWYVYVSV